MHLTLFRLKMIFREHWNVFLSLVICIMLSLVTLAIYAQFNSQKKEVDLLEAEVAMLKNRYDTLKFNKSLTEAQIKDYNKLLATLIPETEDYFSIIYALDEISRKSGFIITDYSIDVTASSKEKLTLSVEGKGDANSFLEFLNVYQFSGGRLATSDKIQYGGTGTTATRINLNFYSKRFAFNETVQVPQLSQEELDKLADIKAKVETYSGGNTFVDTEYTVKKDPFSE